MKVVVCNYRYFVTGGPERYMFSLFNLFEKHGHEAIPFSVAYTKNRESEYSKYFVPTPGSPDQVYFKELNLSPLKKINAAKNVIYSSKAKKKLECLLRDEKPDIVQTLQIHTVLSYSLIDAAKKYNLPVVSRMSNYQLLCPAEHFLRDGNVCEECTRSLFYAIKYKCVQKSIAVSTLRSVSLYVHRIKKTFDKIDRFIVPSNFLKKKMVENGFPEEKVVYVPSFINVDEFQPCYDSNEYIAYSGRIALEKGIPELIQAFGKVRSNIKLVIAGNLNSPEGEKVKEKIKQYDLSKVEFLGYQPLPKLKEVLSSSIFTICPSVWYENSPISVYESYAMGKPVLGTRIGSIEEQIIDGRTGLLFEPDNISDLAEKIEYLYSHRTKVKEMGKEARKFVEKEHCPEVHYHKLLDVYKNVNKYL